MSTPCEITTHCILHRLAVVQQLIHQHHLVRRLRGGVAELRARHVGPGDLHVASLTCTAKYNMK